MKSYLTFLFQRVYCPFQEKIVHLHDMETHYDGTMLKKFYPTFDKRVFLGDYYPKTEATKIAKGLMNPITMLIFQEAHNRKVQNKLAMATSLRYTESCCSEETEDSETGSNSKLKEEVMSKLEEGATFSLDQIPFFRNKKRQFSRARMEKIRQVVTWRLKNKAKNETLKQKRRREETQFLRDFTGEADFGLEKEFLHHFELVREEGSKVDWTKMRKNKKSKLIKKPIQGALQQSVLSFGTTGPSRGVEQTNKQIVRAIEREGQARTLFSSLKAVDPQFLRAQFT